MDLSFDREPLLEGLQRIVGAAEKRTTMSVLSNLRLHEVDGGVRMDTTDLEIGWKLSLSGEIPGGLDIAVPAKKFFELVKLAPLSSTISAKTSDSQLILKFGRSRFVLNLISGNDFPNWEEKPILHKVRVSAVALRRLLDSTQFAVAVQDVRFYLQGLFLCWEGQILRAVGTDGHRLALNEIPVVESNDIPVETIIPRKAVNELRRNLGDNPDAEIEVSFAEGQVYFDFGGSVLMSKTIESRFPDYRRVFPPQFNSLLVIDREEFKESLNRVGVLTSDKYRIVRLNAGPDRCVLSVHNVEQEVGEVEFSGEFTGESVDVCFNFPYVMDVVSALESEKMAFDFRDSESSLVLRSEPADRGRYVVMPSRV